MEMNKEIWGIDVIVDKAVPEGGALMFDAGQFVVVDGRVMSKAEYEDLIIKGCGATGKQPKEDARNG